MPRVQTIKTTTISPAERNSGYFQDVATRIVWFVTGVILILLAFRFVLALLGANPGNSFANFIYSTSHTFVAPFFSLFSYNYHNGISHLEAYTLVAAMVYAVVAWIITALINIGRPADEI